MEQSFCMSCMRPFAGRGQVCPECLRRFGGIPGYPYSLRAGVRLCQGKYLIGRVLGAGGFGVTYLGLDLSLRQRVAIKELYPRNLVSRGNGETEVNWHSGMGSPERFRKAFLAEAQKLARLRQLDSVVSVKESFSDNGTAYIVMDYIDGETLSQALGRNGGMTAEICLRVLRPILSALTKVHRRRMIHRDISPDNIMLDRSGNAWLLDLGAAKDLDTALGHKTQTTSMVTRNGFSPLELYAQSYPIGPWTDVYAMCATIYYCLTGLTVPMALERVERDTLQMPAYVPAPVAQVLLKGLAVEPGRRLRSMELLLRLLEKAVAGERIDSLLRFLPLPRWLWPALIGSGAALAAVLLLFAFDVLPPQPTPTALPSAADAVPSKQPLTVAELGTSSANMINDSAIAFWRQDVCAYVTADGGLYLALRDPKKGGFQLREAERKAEGVRQVVPGGERLYFFRRREDGRTAVCAMDAAEEIGEAYVPSGYSRLDLLQYARLSDGEAYLYFTEQSGANCPLLRLNLGTGALETVLEGNVSWYALHDASVYYTCLDGDAQKYLLMASSLTGEDARVLDDTYGYIGGFLEDDALFLCSMTDNSLWRCELDGSSSRGPDGVHVDSERQAYGYAAGWIIYNDMASGSLRRVRPDGTGDSPVLEGHTATAICYADYRLYFQEDIPTDTEFQVQSQNYCLVWDSAYLTAVQPFCYSWTLLEASVGDLAYELSDTSATILGYHGSSSAFALPESIEGRKVTAIGASAFRDSGLESIVIPSTVERIEDSAFYDCWMLRSVVLSEGLREIGKWAFDGCTALTGVKLPDSLELVDSLAFHGSALSSVHIPAKLTFIGPGAFAVLPSAGMDAFTVEEGNAAYRAWKGVLYQSQRSLDTVYYEINAETGERTRVDSARDAVLIAYPSGRQDAEYSIPAGTVGIETYAFMNSSGPRSLTVPDSVSAIDSAAFLDSGVNEISVSRDCRLPSGLDSQLEIRFR